MKYNKSILSKNIKNLMEKNSISQEGLAEAINKTVPLQQPRVSACLSDKKSDNFTIEQIVEIACFFNVSVDFLLGISEKEAKKKKTAREICESIVDIYTNTDINYALVQDTLSSANHISIYFPQMLYLTEEQSEHDINKHISIFIERLKDLNQLRRKGNLNNEMFYRLIESYLNDVPEIFFMNDIDIMTSYPANNTFLDSEISLY